MNKYNLLNLLLCWNEVSKSINMYYTDSLSDGQKEMINKMKSFVHYLIHWVNNNIILELQ